MISRSRFTLSLALGTAALLFAFVPTAGAQPQTLDQYCSSSGDICQSILASKKGNVKFELTSATASVQGDYTLCVKGPDGKECEDFVLEQLPDEEIWSDKVSWKKEFSGAGEPGSYTVKWKYQGERIGNKLHFDIGSQGESKKPEQIDSYCSESGDVCQEITLSKQGGRIKFGIYSFTAAVQGPYTLCVKGPGSKECNDYELEQLPDEGARADRVNWADDFPATRSGPYVVKWKYQGERLGKKLHFEIGAQGEA